MTKALIYQYHDDQEKEALVHHLYKRSYKQIPFHHGLSGKTIMISTIHKEYVMIDESALDIYECRLINGHSSIWCNNLKQTFDTIKFEEELPF